MEMMENKLDEAMEKRMEEFSGKVTTLIDDYYEKNLVEGEVGTHQLDFELIVQMANYCGWIVQLYDPKDVQAMLSDFADWVWDEKKRLNKEQAGSLQ